MDIVLLFPGQGSQTPGMGRDVAAAYPAAREVFDRVDAALNTSLSTLAFEGPAEDLTLTYNAQPALLTHSAATWAVTRSELQSRVKAMAGHSLGEFTAYHAANALTLEAAVKLVRKRGELMYEAGMARPGAMAAVLGQLAVSIDDVCRQASSQAGEVVPANYNAPEQTVVSGEVAGVERLMVLAKEHGAKRAVRLPVSGAFHSPLMSPSISGLHEALNAAGFIDARVPIYANVDAQPTTGAQRARELLLEQLTSPVRWVDIIRHLSVAYPSALFVEMGTGAVLSGLVKRIAPQVVTATCGTPAEIDHLLQRVTAQPGNGRDESRPYKNAHDGRSVHAD